MKALLCFLLLSVAARAEEGDVSSRAPAVVDGETLDRPASAEGRPGFSGDVRWRLRDASPRSEGFSSAPPSLRHAPYASQRLRARWGGLVEAGLLTLRPSPGPSLSPEDLRRSGVVKGYVDLPGKAVVGDYSLSFGQGLLFYDGLGEFVRPAWVQGRGASPDLGSSPDEHLRGAALQAGRGRWRALVFASRRRLDLALNPDGTAADSPWDLRGGSTPEDEADLAARDTVAEETAGFRLEGEAGAARWGATGARVRYLPAVDPPAADFGGTRVFRGRRNDLWGVDGSFSWAGWRAAADAAFSDDGRRRARAAAATLFHREEDGAFWATLFDHGADYFARQGQGPTFEVGDLPTNQRGVSAGVERETAWGRLAAEAAWARFPRARGDGRNEDPVFASQARRWRLESTWRAAPRWELTARVQERVRERYASPPGGLRRQGEETVRRARLESLWSASPRLRLKARHDVRWERTPFLGRRAEGKLVMAEARWTPKGPWAAAGRWYAFHSPEAFLTTGVEEVWDGVSAPLLAGGQSNLRGGSGDRYALSTRWRWGENVRTWVKYDATRRWRGAAAAGARHVWHMQVDVSW